jgi:ADP-dependent NAD(P)H-hydrate dehydratase / NAD(P)H-hydrate epimerase
MRPIVTADEMRQADAAAIAAGTPADVLMERAGAAVARAVLRLTSRRYGAQVTVVCGPGNNGGDGYVTARLLRAQGAAVRCVTVASPSELKGAAATAYANFVRAGGVVKPWDPHLITGSDVVVDALFGTGFHGEPRGTARDAITAFEEARNAPRSVSRAATGVAVDVPSGAGGSGPMVHSDVTVALGAEKLETASAGAELAGVVEVADIGIPIASPGACMAEPADLIGVAHRDPSAHKWTRSVALVAGSDAMSGAAVLAARAAFRAGAGYVTVVTSAGTAGVVRRSLPEAVVRAAAGSQVLGPEAIALFMDTFDKAGAVAVGPGLGTGDDQRETVLRLLREMEVPVVLDADGLNVVQDDTDALRACRAPLVLTPHAGELARLLGGTSDEIERDRVAAVREASERFGCTVLLKGPRTLICHTGRALMVNPTGGPELATAGTGDVLSGVLAALASGGTDAFIPAWKAAYIHGRAGEIASQHKGPVGIVASDVAEALPATIAELSSP